MNYKHFKKELIIGIIILFVWAGFISCISGSLIIQNKKTNETFLNNLNQKDILFSDDFNDNIIDYSKWSEFYSDGEWKEVNHRVEFKCYESSNTNQEGIKSKDISALITEEIPLEVTCQMISCIDHHYYNWVGQIWSQVVQGENHISVYYRRDVDELHVLDSQGTDMVLFTLGDGNVPWDVHFTIYNDRYKVEVCNVDSGWIYNSIISSDNYINLIFYMYCNGDYQDLWYKAGIDNVEVFLDSQTQTNPPLTPTIEGPTSGKIGVSYVFTTTTTDPDGDKIYYLFNWGDKTESIWIGPYSSDSIASVSNIWKSEGTFIVKVKACDVNGAVSDWSDPLAINIPRTKTSMSQLFFNLAERFLIFQQIFNRS